MANPAPTINQINAFNATQGTVIDFNIIGGTELVRSNKIYIYDLSDNSLICTHLYPSTESIHELPPNNDASMIYASGKSSADFVNNKQYYAQIQTFTNTGGTEGGSGVSVAKLFWCLPNPSLAFDPIDPQIATTTYNATATYDSNITSENVTVPNIVQQYQFDLYTGAGALMESSGVIVGNGTQIGTTTEWTLTYNFSNLVVGSSYYFKVNVLTTEGMELSAQSGTFTVDIATPTMDKATVSNDACNGYISVTSNLSSEYEHSASGDDILTFETESVNDVSSLKVDLSPKQDGTPWIASSDETAPYLLRQSGGGNVGHSFNRENDTLVGGSVAWNQSVEDETTTYHTSGNIISVTDAEAENLESCVVELEPWQDGTPWMANNDDIAPYLFRQSGDDNVGHSFNSETDALVGGSVVWNQLIHNGNFVDASGWQGPSSIAVSNNVLTYTAVTGNISITATGQNYRFPETPNNHKYFATADVKLTTGTTNVRLRLNGGYREVYTKNTTEWQTLACIYNYSTVDNKYFQIQDGRGGNYDQISVRNCMCIDLTQMFGATIADYVYSLEQSTSGSGIAWLKSYGFFTKPYYSYDAGTIKSVEAISHDMIGTNAWDEQWEVGAYSSSDGSKVNASNRIRNKNFIRVVPNTSYYFKASSALSVYGYDANKQWVRQLTTVQNQTQTIPQDVYYITFNTGVNSGTTYNNNICINISDANIDGKYFPYESQTYPLANITLRGAPKLDANNKLYYDGDIYASDGSVTRNYKSYTFTGTETWSRYVDGGDVWYTPQFTDGLYSHDSYAIMNGFVSQSAGGGSEHSGNMEVWMQSTSSYKRFYVCISGASSASDVQSATVGKNVIYPLNTSTTEVTQPFTNPQQVNQYGTEEYITNNEVPVGHTTRYADIYRVHGWKEFDVVRNGKNLFNVTPESTDAWEQTNTGYRVFNTVAGTYRGVAFNMSPTWSKYISGATMTFSASAVVTQGSARILCSLRNSDGTSKSNIFELTGTTYNRTFTVPNISNGEYIRFTLYSTGATSETGDVTYSDIQLELGSTKTEYNQFTTTTYDITLPSYDQTLEQNQVPYVSKNLGNIYADELRESVIGGTVAWNQMFTAPSSAVLDDITNTFSDGVMTCTGTAVRNYWFITSNQLLPIIAGHKYYVHFHSTKANPRAVHFRNGNSTTPVISGAIISISSTLTGYATFTGSCSIGDEVDEEYIPQMFDLTQMFGSTIADYIYTLETNNVGAGVQFFKSLFPNDYYEYNAGELISVNASAHVIRGEKNLFPQNKFAKASEYKYYKNSYYYSDPLYLKPNTTYTISPSSIENVGVSDYYGCVRNLDSDDPSDWTLVNADIVYPVTAGVPKVVSITTGASGILRFAVIAGGQQGVKESALNAFMTVKWQLEEGTTVTPYEPNYYYALDSDLTLRGLLKLDSNNKAYYDGDVYESNGSVTRKYGVVDLGTLSWLYSSDNSRFYSTGINTLVKANTQNILCEKYKQTTSGEDKSVQISSSQLVLIYDSAYTDPTVFKTAMDGVYLVYELATPTTESADPFETHQSVMPYAIEEYIVTPQNGVSMPVGHNTTYYSIEIFGANVDVVKGTIEVKEKLTNINSFSGSFNTTNNGYAVYKTLSDRADSPNTLSNMFVADKNHGIDQMPLGTYQGQSGVQTTWSFIIPSFVTSLTESQQWLKTNGQLVVTENLSTTTQLTFTPTTITALSGANTMFSSTNGNIDVTYPTNHSYQSLNTTHKYYTKLNGTETISVGSNIVATVGTDMVVDLTLMFGSTIADYVYGLEQATSGSGVAWLKGYGFFTNSRYAYNSGELVSVNASEHVTRGFNAWDEEWELGGINSSTGANYTSSSAIRSKNYIPVISGATYYFKSTSYQIVLLGYDADKNFVSGAFNGYNTAAIQNVVFTIPEGVRYLRFNASATTYNNDICINISKTTGSPKNGDYVPYTYHTYPLADIQLRGIPQLNANNKLTYNGDEYRADGGVTRNYGIVDLGALTWNYGNNGGQWSVYKFYASVSGMKSNTQKLICTKYPLINQFEPKNYIYVSSNYVYIGDDAYTDATTFKSAMSGVYLIYEKATSTTEQTTPFESPQQVDQYGTEEYVDTRSVPIPVGHKTRYSDEYPVYGWDEVDVFARGVNQWDEEWELGQFNNTTGEPISANDCIRSKNFIPVLPNTVYYSTQPISSFQVFYYDANETFISQTWVVFATPFTTPSNCYYMKFRMASQYGTTYNHDISINYPSTDTSYHAYQGATYTKTLPDYDQLLAQNKVPYVTKRVGSDYADVLSEDIIGGTVAWNQLANTWRIFNVSSAVSTDTELEANRNCTIDEPTNFDIIGHVYIASFEYRCSSDFSGTVNVRNNVTVSSAVPITPTANKQVYSTLKTSNAKNTFNIQVTNYASGSVYFKNFMLIDLTQLFGSTIADYIYNLEQTTQGAGVQWFKSLFPNDYYSYNAGELKSVNVGAHNILDEHMDVVESYPLDSSLTLRGIPKLDANNRLYYDGDVYSADGSVSRRYAQITFDGTESIRFGDETTTHKRFVISGVTLPLAKMGSTQRVVCNVGADWTARNTSSESAFNAIDIRDGYMVICVAKTIYIGDNTPQSFASFIAGKIFVYELATPTTESADSFESRQSITPYGYEQYCVTSNNELVPTFVPVGHDTKYYATKIFGGEVDLVSGVVKIDKACDAFRWSDGAGEYAPSGNNFKRRTFTLNNTPVNGSGHSITNCIDTYNAGIPTTTPYFYVDTNFYAWLPTDTAESFPLQLCYELATPIYIHMSPEQIQTLVGENNMWTNGDSLSLDYNIPVTALLVKRQDTSNPSGTWLTLYMKPVTQADDMDFTYIDFLNQYGKTYKYALVPLLRQKQGDVDVEIEGGYTLSNAVDSVFDGVFIADADMSQRVKAGASYGNVTTNQSVGALTPIGAQYPVIITNSHNRYDSGSISGYILPSDFYSTGNLSRTDIVKKYNEIKQFLTNKKPKVIKDWNGNIWLTMILDNIDCSFDNNYGMGMITFSANWVQVGDATNQEDLQSTGLVNVGGV